MSLWFISQCTQSKSQSPQGKHVVASLMLEARRLLEAKQLSTEEEIKLSDSRATNEWVNRVMRGGTMPDKISAILLIVREKPLQCLKHLDRLIVLVTPAKKRDCLLAMDALHQAFLEFLLPAKRALIPFEARPLNSLPESVKTKNKKKNKKESSKPNKLGDTRNDSLSIWIFEEELRTRYIRFLKGVEQVLLLDTIEATKRKAMNILFNLLERKPEGRERILEIVINKLGDPNRALASNAVYKLNKLVKHRNNLTSDILDNVESLIFRPNVSVQAQYYAIGFLNQIYLQQNNADSSKVAVRLVKIYASFFKTAVKERELNEKILLAVLTGVNRAVPFIEGGISQIEEQLSILFKLVHTTTFSIALQALMVLQHVIAHKEELKDRFYQALYRKLLDTELRRTSKQAMCILLLYKSLAVDDDVQRIKAFLKRLLQVCSMHWETGFVCGILIMISKLSREKPELLAGEQMREVELSDDDDEEHFTDIDSDEEADATGDSPLKINGTDHPRVNGEHTKDPLTQVSWDHRVQKEGPRKSGYDPHARNPRFCNAAGELMWELEILARSTHPSVAIFASKLLENDLVDYTGDPFEDFSLMHFLDRFVFKNPKQSKRKESKANMSRGVIPVSGAKALPVNSDAYLAIKEANIPEDEKFFYRYFKFINQKGLKNKKKESDEEESDEEEEIDAEFDAYLDKYEKQLDQDAKDNGLKDREDLDDDELTDLSLSDEDFGLNSDDMSEGMDDDFDDEFADGEDGQPLFRPQEPGDQDSDESNLDNGESGSDGDGGESDSDSEEEDIDIDMLKGSRKRKHGPPKVQRSAKTFKRRRK